MEPIETISGKAGLEARIYQDEDPESPRGWDNLGRIATVHLRNSRLTDESEGHLPEDLSGWDAVERYLERERGAAIILPVFMYDHGGVAISTSSFIGRAQHASWDSGQVGFIYATRAAILKEYSVTRITAGTKAKVIKVLEGEIETFNQYISGDVFGYQIVKPCPTCGQENSDVLDSCWGFYGLDYARKEATSALEAAARGSLAWYEKHNKEKA
jgi:hypothetical protein